MPVSPRRVAAVAALLAATALPGAAGAARTRPLLPNLVALRTKAVFLGGPQTYGLDAAGDVIACCHATELTDTPTPVRCLRFDTNAANAGTGPLELHHHTNEAATTRRVTQRVYNADGTYIDREAGTYELHAAHAHFHYNDFAVSSLWRSDARGRRLDKVPVRQGHKAGFCLQDVYAFRSPAPAPRYTGPVSCYPTDVSPKAEISQVTGVSAGWVDVYDLSLPHQYIEVSGIPDGFYLLQIEIDPDHRLREATTRDNSSWQLVRLCGDKVDLVGRTATCAGRP